MPGIVGHTASWIARIAGSASVGGSRSTWASGVDRMRALPLATRMSAAYAPIP